MIAIDISTLRARARANPRALLRFGNAFAFASRVIDACDELRDRPCLQIALDEVEGFIFVWRSERGGRAYVRLRTTIEKGAWGAAPKWGAIPMMSSADVVEIEGLYYDARELWLPEISAIARTKTGISLGAAGIRYTRRPLSVTEIVL